jgi:pantoate--beta-alanine ligase
MGALHAGHRVLIERAVGLLGGADGEEEGSQASPVLARGEMGSAGRVVVSIFVNPLQFGPAEDFARYPRDLKRDVEMAEAAGATDVFAPSVEEFSPADITTAVDPGPLADTLCGPFRPGHFSGVCTIVLKLFNVVQPTHAVFGWKDAQQFIILKKMVRDLDLGLEMVGVETVREPDGLAMSSRNAYLCKEERAVAPALQRTLQETREALLCGAIATVDAEPFARERLKMAGISDVDYVTLVSAEDLGAPGADGPWLLAGAVRVGKTRLIDNLRYSIR